MRPPGAGALRLKFGLIILLDSPVDKAKATSYLKSVKTPFAVNQVLNAPKPSYYQRVNFMCQGNKYYHFFVTQAKTAIRENLVLDSVFTDGIRAVSERIQRSKSMMIMTQAILD